MLSTRSTAASTPNCCCLVDDRFAHGNLRDWASFTYTAAKLCADHGRDRLDEETARNALTLHGYFGG